MGKLQILAQSKKRLNHGIMHAVINVDMTIEQYAKCDKREANLLCLLQICSVYGQNKDRHLFMAAILTEESLCRMVANGIVMHFLLNVPTTI